MNHTLVLVITEDTSLQNGLLALLTTIQGVGAVLVAENCSSGVRILKIHKPQLVFLDMTLPEESDPETLTELISHLSDIATIAITDNVQQNKIAISLEADAVLFKGFSPASLVSITEELLMKRETENQPHNEKSDYGTDME